MIFRPKVLVLAEAANPEWVSVPLVGWSLSTALRRVADVHIVTQIRNRDAFLRAGLVEGRDFTAIDSERVAAPLHRLADRLTRGRGGWTVRQFVTSVGYRYFEHLVWRHFGADIRAGKYDIVHRVTPVFPVVTSPIARKCRRAEVPFILGPINGGLPWPKGFGQEQRREREWMSTLRGLYKLNPMRGRTLADSAAILCGSRGAMAEIPQRFRDKAVYLPENAIDPTRFALTAQQPGTLPVRTCFIGRLVPLKGVDMALMAAAPFLRAGQMQFDIIGDGPQMPALRRIVQDQGLEQAVRFHGWLEHHDVQTAMQRCHLLLFPSIREFGGGAVLEAMALGVVPVVMNYGGPAELVDDATGWTVPMGTRDQVIAAIGAQLARIVAHPQMLVPRAAAAQQRVARDFSWDAKARQILRLWQAVLRGDTSLPDVMVAASPAGPDDRDAPSAKPPDRAA